MSNNYVKAPVGYGYYFFDDRVPDQVRRAFEWAELQAFPLTAFITYAPVPFFRCRNIGAVLSLEELSGQRSPSDMPWDGVSTGRPRG